MSTCTRFPLFTRVTWGHACFFAFDPEWSACASVSIIKLSPALFAHRLACQGDCRVTGCYRTLTPQATHTHTPPPPDASTPRHQRAPSHRFWRPGAAAGLFFPSVLFFYGPLCPGFSFTASGLFCFVTVECRPRLPAYIWMHEWATHAILCGNM